jgi:hypothetical protein
MMSNVCADTAEYTTMLLNSKHRSCTNKKKIWYRKTDSYCETKEVVESILTTVKNNIMQDGKNLTLNESDKKLYDLATAGHDNQSHSSLIEHENILSRLEKLRKIIYNACKMITKHIQ